MSDHGPTLAQVEILHQLKQVGHSSAKQIAAVQNVTPMSVRSHLTALEKTGLVRITLERRATGRPTHIYFPDGTGEEGCSRRLRGSGGGIHPMR